jgi:hypothetical protein
MLHASDIFSHPRRTDGSAPFAPTGRDVGSRRGDRAGRFQYRLGEGMRGIACTPAGEQSQIDIAQIGEAGNLDEVRGDQGAGEDGDTDTGPDCC